MLNEYAQIAHQKFLAREREKLRADKRLRDAAPDLLAALKPFAEGRNAIARLSLQEAVDLTERVRAAIAKAEGVS